MHAQDFIAGRIRPGTACWGYCAGLVSKEIIMLDNLWDGRFEETHSDDGPLEQVTLISPQHSAGPLEFNRPGQREEGTLGPVPNGGCVEYSMMMHIPEESVLGAASVPCIRGMLLQDGSNPEPHVGANEQNCGLVSEKINMLDNLCVDSFKETHSDDGPLGQVALISPQHSAGPLEIDRPVSPQCQVAAHLSTLPPISPRSLGLSEPLESAILNSPIIQSCRMQPNPYETALKVYSRRRQHDSVGQVDAPKEESPSKQQFFEMVSKKIGSLLPTPNATKRRKPAIPSQELCRSRRVAGLGAEHIPQIPRAKMVVMKAIHNTSDATQLNCEDLETYAKLFCHPLSYSQIQALAALFGWAVPDYLGGAATLVC
jgi:hypothetical protein